MDGKTAVSIQRSLERIDYALTQKIKGKQRTQTYDLNGETLTVHSVENGVDMAEFREWLDVAMWNGPVGFDTETTGLKTYTGDVLRTIQFGDANTGWFIPVEGHPEFLSDIKVALTTTPVLIAHNCSFDLQVIAENLDIPMEKLWPRVQDTKILAHLIDPRSAEDNLMLVDKGLPSEHKAWRPGAPFGHSLEDLLKKYVDKKAAEEVKSLMAKLARVHRTTKAHIFETIPLDDDNYALYSGLDPVWAVRLFQILNPLVPAQSRHLISYEHELAAVCATVEEQGFQRDEEYCQALSDKFRAEEKEALWHLDTFFDLTTANSPTQLVEVLEEEFHFPREQFALTPKGNPSVDSKLLESLEEENPEIGSIGHFAAAVIEAKRKSKWRTSWVDKFVSNADPCGRVHASINPLRARTARMSITGIPAQTLPSRDWTVRRCFRADDGHVQASVDYDSQELRVLAALSQDPVMMHAFENGLDLHQITADAIGHPRKVGKAVNFGSVYGIGARKLALDIGAPESEGKQILRTFRETYQGVAEYSKYMQSLAQQYGFITTPLGRVLPVDEERPFAAVNYVVQSTSRDITCRGVLNLHKHGFTPYLRLIIHDEVLMSFPEEHAHWMTDAVVSLMGTELRGVDISASGEIGGRSWGSLYSCQITPDCGKPKHKPAEACEPSEFAAKWKDLVAA